MSLSIDGHEYLTAFGEFNMNKKNEEAPGANNRETFQTFMPLADYDPAQSPLFPEIQQIVQEIKENQQKAPTS